MSKILSISGILLGFALSFHAGGFNLSDLFTPPKAHNIWNDMRSRFKLTKGMLAHPQVQHQINWYVNHQYDLFEISQNAQPYLYYVYQQTQQRNMPAILALLPMIESNYNPFTHSSVGATGLWQLMPSTAKAFGISMDYWFDGRRDIVSSTNTALNYLQYLHDTFHDWYLAIAAYNSGPGAVENAIRYNKRHHRPTDFWHLPLPQQTKSYVPKLIALATIIERNSHYGLRLLPIPNQPYFTEVKLHHQWNINTLSTLSNVDPKLFRKLNPAFRRAKTAPFSSYYVLIPETKADTLEENLEKKTSSSTKKHETTTKYHVKSGDSLSRIAAHFGTSTETLQTLNHLKHNIIRIGQALIIPNKKESNTSDFEKQHHAEISESNFPGPRAINIHVRRGDSISVIAHRYHVSTQDIYRWNPTTKHTMLKAGQKLLLHLK